MTVRDCVRLIDDLLEGYPVRVYTNKDENYVHLPDDFKLWVIGEENRNEVTVDILFEGVREFTVFFSDWHGHFRPERDDMRELRRYLKGILSNEAFCLEIRTKDARSFSSLCFGECSEEAIRGCAGDEMISSADEIKCSFWDKSLDKNFR